MAIDLNTIDWNTIISSFDDRGTLLNWLKKLEESYGRAIIDTVGITTVDDTHVKLKFIFEDGTIVESDTITLAQGPQGEPGEQGPEGPQGPQGEPGEVMLASLIALLEGSDYISVNYNETADKVKIELDETMLDEEVTEDSNNLITSGAVFDGLSGKMNNTKAAISNAGGLVVPCSTPAEKMATGVDETNSQAMYKFGEGLTVEGATSPFTVKASAGGTPIGAAEIQTTVTIGQDALDIITNPLNPVVQGSFKILASKTIPTYSYDNLRTVTPAYFQGGTSSELQILCSAVGTYESCGVFNPSYASIEINNIKYYGTKSANFLLISTGYNYTSGSKTFYYSCCAHKISVIKYSSESNSIVSEEYTVNKKNSASLSLNQGYYGLVNISIPKLADDIILYARFTPETPLEGTWLFNDLLGSYAGTSPIHIDADFTSNGVQYHQIELQTTTTNNAIISMYYQNTDGTNRQYVWGTGNWADNAYKTINVITQEDATALAFLRDRATKQ